MAMEETVTVGLSVEDATTRHLVLRAVEASGAHPLPLTRVEVRGAVKDGRLDAWVYDLAPWNPSAVQLLNTVCLCAPRPAIWLFHPPDWVATQLLTQLPSRKRVWATSQLSRGFGDEGIRLQVGQLLSWVPRVWLMKILANLLGPRPPAIRTLLEEAVRRLAMGEPGIVKLQDLTGGREVAAGRSGAHRLERLCKSENLPAPKRLLRDLTLVFVTFMAYVLDLSVTASAHRAGLSGKGLYQLRHDVLGAAEPWGDLPAGEQFGFAMAAFAEACGTPSRNVQTAIYEVGHRLA